MSLITLMFHDDDNAEKTTEKTIAWNELFGPNRAKNKIFAVGDQEVCVWYVNNILAISSVNDVDIIFRCDKPLPIHGLYIQTAGYLNVTGASLNLDLGLWANAYDIQIDTVLQSRGFIRLDVAVIDDNGDNILDGSVQLNEKIEANRLIIQAYDLKVNAHVFANIPTIQFDTLTIEPLAKLCGGDKQVVFKHHMTNSTVAAMVTWNEITKSTSVSTTPSIALKCLLGNKLTNKGTLHLCGAELKIDGDIVCGISSKTVYEDVNVFCSGGMNVCDKAVVDGNNAYFKFAKDINIDGECKIENLAIVGRYLNVQGLLDGGKQLNIAFSGLIQNHGLINANKANISANNIITTSVKNDKNCIYGLFKQGGIVGSEVLNINALGVLVAGGGYLYSPNVQLRTAFYANFAGTVCAFNFVNRSIFVLDFGLNVPCAPASLSDLANSEKLFRLSCRVMGNSFPMFRNAATLGTLAAPLGKFIKSTAAEAAKQGKHFVHDIYNNPKKQFHNGLNAVNDFKNNVSAKDFIPKAKETMKQISEAWNKTRWLELLNYLLTVQDWYISADMIMTQGTSALVFANDVKISLKSPSITLEGIANNFANTFNNTKKTLAAPEFVNNVYDAASIQLEELKAVPINAGKKLYAQGVNVVNAVSDPLDSANKLSASLSDSINSVTLDNAKKGILEPLVKKKHDFLKASSNLCFGAENADYVANDPQVAKDKPTVFKQTALDLAVMFTPSIDKRAIASISGGVTIAGSVMEDNLFNSHNGVTAAISSSNYSLFGFHNSGGIYSNYRNEFIGNRYNTGDVHVGTMYLNAGNNTEHGDFQYSKFIFDIARDFSTVAKTKMSANGHVHGVTHGNFYGAGDFTICSGQFAVKGNYVVEKGAFHTISDDVQFVANIADIYGNLQSVNGAKVNVDYGTVYDGGKYAINNATHTGDSLTFKPGSSIDIRDDIISVKNFDDQGATVYAENHITFAEKFTRGGNWTYSGFLYEQLDKITTTPASMLKRVDIDAEYSLDTNEADLHGAEKHSSVLSHIASMTTSDAVDYGLGRGKYSMIEVTENCDISSESTENSVYAGSRANGARVQVQTKGHITLPLQYERARGMTFANYEEADYFIRAVYPTHNLPPPQPKKRHGIKKHLDKISKVFATVAVVFANGKDPITLAIGAISAGIAVGADKLDKHYSRNESRDLEKLELERARLQQALDHEGLSMQEKNFLSSLKNQDHMRRVNSSSQRLQNADNQNYNDVISNTWSLEAAKQQAIPIALQDANATLPIV